MFAKYVALDSESIFVKIVTGAIDDEIVRIGFFYDQDTYPCEGYVEAMISKLPTSSPASARIEFEDGVRRGSTLQLAHQCTSLKNHRLLPSICLYFPKQRIT